MTWPGYTNPSEQIICGSSNSFSASTKHKLSFSYKLVIQDFLLGRRGGHFGLAGQIIVQTVARQVKLVGGLYHRLAETVVLNDEIVGQQKSAALDRTAPLYQDMSNNPAWPGPARGQSKYIKTPLLIELPITKSQFL